MEFNIKKVKVGMMVEGKVFMVTDNSVHLDLGSYAEGVIYKEHMSLDNIDSCKDIVKEGDVLQCKVAKIDTENQTIYLTRKDALHQEKRSQFETFSKTAKSFNAKVKQVTRGGLVMDYDGVEMFMPISHIDVEHVNAEDFAGKTLEVTVIENDGRKIVVSRRKVLEFKLRQARKDEFETLTVGQKITGKVVKLAAFGAFVQVGSNQGLVHRSEISHHRVNDVASVLAEGQEITAEIISKDKGKIGLSMKKLEKTPWEIFSETNKVGDEVTGKIVRKMATGMLVEIARDVVGIINKKDYSWDPRTNLAGEVEVGSEVSLKILSIDPKNRKMSLSKKHLDYNPWKDVTVKFGEEVNGEVEELQSRGALVKIQGVKAFLPIGEIQDERVNEIAQVLKVGDPVKAVVTNIDKEQWKMSISIKQLVEGKQRAEFEDYLKTEEKVSNTTLGDLFGDTLNKFKK